MNIGMHAGRLQEPAWVPLVFRWCKEPEQMTWEELVSDASSCVFALRSAHQLLGTDAVLNHFDPALEAEACGATVVRDEEGVPVSLTPPAGGVLPGVHEVLTRGHVPLAVETARRLCAELGDRLLVWGYLTGPYTLSAALGDSGPDSLRYAGSVAVSLARQYLDAGIGGLVIAEDLPPRFPAMAEALRDLVNLAGFYEVPLWLVSRQGFGDDDAASAVQMGVRPVGTNTHLVIPVDLLSLGEAAVAAWCAQRTDARQPAVLTSSWEVPPSVDVNTLIQVRNWVKPGP